MNRSELLVSFQNVRQMTKHLCQPLCTEDYVIQSMPDVSPPKWHLGHTTWFYERIILERYAKGYQPYHPQYDFVFNSYYQSLGQRVARDIRGTLSRPTVEEVYNYRTVVDEKLRNLIETIDQQHYSELAELVELGLNHEQQHQELLVTDVKHILASNPLRPIYQVPTDHGLVASPGLAPGQFQKIEGGFFEIGATDQGFAWDNERPRHKMWLADFDLMDRLVTCGEYLDFINDGGYRDPLLWLSDGWDTLCVNDWRAPLYWEEHNGDWKIMTLSGSRTLILEEPVTHVSFYEAAAYARWAEKRLPTEVEWERAALLEAQPLEGNFLESGYYHPLAKGCVPGGSDNGLCQMFGDAWEWTASAYLPYPGYQQDRGPLGEYNGKFMSNQMILRGGSCATPRSHIRPSYRNFFHCDKRWQFAGIRLANDST